MQHLDLTDEEAAALTQELHDIVENDRYPFSPRVQILRAILHKLRPEPQGVARLHARRGAKFQILNLGGLRIRSGEALIEWLEERRQPA
jgi:hypothetical protein